MNPSRPLGKYLILGFLLIVLPCTLFIFNAMKHNFKSVAHFHPVDIKIVEKEGKEINDTVWHQVPDFSFLNQDGELVTQDYFKDKIYVADFFFTTCKTICPIMSTQMQQLIWKLEDKTYDDVYFISHTVDPEIDTPEILKAYAKKLDADTKKWVFVTGNKDDLYRQGVYGYFLSTAEDALAPGGFLHSNLFVLVDKNRNIRGYYDGTDSDEVDRLSKDIKMLLAEYKKAARANP